MHLELAWHLIFLAIFFYQYIIQPRRYGLFFGKLLLFTVLFLPAIAHWDWWHDGIEEREEAAKATAFSLYIVAIFVTASWVIVFDQTAPWHAILVHLGGYYVVLGTFSIFVQSLHQGRFSPLNFGFLFKHSPGIVARYIERLPQDGPSHSRSLLKGIVATFDEAFRLDPKNDTLIMEMQAIVANVSAAKNTTSVRL